MIIEHTTMDKLPAKSFGRPRNTEGISGIIRNLQVGEAVWIATPQGMPLNRHQGEISGYAVRIAKQTGSKFTTRVDRQNNRVAVGRVA